MSMQNSVAQAERAADRPHGEQRPKWIEKLLLRILSLSPGAYWLMVVVAEDGSVKWSVNNMGKMEG